MKKICAAGILSLFLFSSLFGQELAPFPKVENSLLSVQYAFVKVLENIVSMDNQSYTVQRIIESENPTKKYQEYLDFVLTNMTYDKIRTYLFTINDVINNIDFQDFSKNQQEDFEHFLDTAIIDKYNFRVESNFLDEHIIPQIFELKYDTSKLESLSDGIQKLEPKIAEMSERFASLENPSDEKVRRFNEVYEEMAMLNNKSHRTSAAVAKTQKRLDELRQIEKDIRENPSPLAIEYQSLQKQIAIGTTELNQLKQTFAYEQKNIPRLVKQEFKQQLCKNINKFQTWIAFFNNENTIIKDFMLIMDVKNNLTQILDNEVPQRLVPEYQKKLSVFCTGWSL